MPVVTKDIQLEEHPGVADTNLVVVTGMLVKMEAIRIVTREDNLLAIEEGILAAIEEGSLVAIEEDILVAAEEDSLAVVEEGNLAVAEEDSLAVIEEGNLVATEVGNLEEPVVKDRVAALLEGIAAEEGTKVGIATMVGNSFVGDTREGNRLEGDIGVTVEDIAVVGKLVIRSPEHRIMELRIFVVLHRQGLRLEQHFGHQAESD